MCVLGSVVVRVCVSCECAHGVGCSRQCEREIQQESFPPPRRLPMATRMARVTTAMPRPCIVSSSSCLPCQVMLLSLASADSLPQCAGGLSGANFGLFARADCPGTDWLQGCDTDSTDASKSIASSRANMRSVRVRLCVGIASTLSDRDLPVFDAIRPR